MLQRGHTQLIEQILNFLGRFTYKAQQTTSLDMGAWLDVQLMANSVGTQYQLTERIIAYLGNNIAVRLNQEEHRLLKVFYSHKDGCCEVGCHAIQFLFDRHHFQDSMISRIQSIKFTNIFVLPDDPTEIAMTIVTVEYNDSSDKEYYIIPETKFMIDIINLLCSYCPYIDIEERMTKKFRLTMQPNDATFWSDEELWGADSENTQAYADTETGIDNTTLACIKNHLLDRTNGGTLLVIDVGGGDGRLAEKVINEATISNVKLKYILIEPDRHQAEKAKARLQNVQEHQVFVYNGSLLDFIDEFSSRDEDFHEMLQSKDIMHIFGSAGAVISSGGPLNVEIVSHQVAEDNLHAMKRLLSYHGRIIATGLSYLHFSKNELLNQFGLFSYQTVDEKHGSTYRVGSRFNQAYVLGVARPS